VDFEIAGVVSFALERSGSTLPAFIVDVYTNVGGASYLGYLDKVAPTQNKVQKIIDSKVSVA
jgi:hypothetical protein